MNYNFIYDSYHFSNLINNNFYHLFRRVISLTHYKDLIGLYVVLNKKDNSNSEYIGPLSDSASSITNETMLDINNLRYHEGYQNFKNTTWLVKAKDGTIYSIEPNGYIYSVSTDSSLFWVVNLNGSYYYKFNLTNYGNLSFYTPPIKLNSTPVDLKGPSLGPVCWKKDGSYKTALFQIGSELCKWTNTSNAIKGGKITINIKGSNTSYLTIKSASGETPINLNTVLSYSFYKKDTNFEEVLLPVYFRNGIINAYPNIDNTSINYFIEFYLDIPDGSSCTEDTFKNYYVRIF